MSDATPERSSEALESALTTARNLARIYGRRLDLPAVYTQGVAISGRLRLLSLKGQGVAAEPPIAPMPAGRLRALEEIEAVVRPVVDSPGTAFGSSAGTANYAAACWSEELYGATGSKAYLDLARWVADRFLPDPAAVRPLLDPDIRVEDFFFAAAVLGRAFKLTGDLRYAGALVAFLQTAVDAHGFPAAQARGGPGAPAGDAWGTGTQQANGLWWHCRSSPYFWGRGNGFAALGFAEALTYLPVDIPGRDRLLDSHIRHLEGLARYQDASGMWREVIDRPDAYLEHSATSMIGCAIARGVRLGWLEPDWGEIARKAWHGVSERTSVNGELKHVCIGTGPQPDLESYLKRPFTDGRDDRGGSMALWFAVEMAVLEAGRGYG